MPRPDVDIICAVNQQYRRPRTMNGVGRISAKEIDAIEEPRICQCYPDSGSQELGRNLRRRNLSVISCSFWSDCRKLRKRRLCNHCAKAMLVGQALQKQSGAIGLPESIDASWM